MKSEEFLLEIGVEEIPHWIIPGALRDLERGFLAALEDAKPAPRCGGHHRSHAEAAGARGERGR